VSLAEDRCCFQTIILSPPSYTRPYDNKSKLFFLVWLDCQQMSLTGAEEKAFVTIEISKERISAICM
jgi:hypothetical protein